MPASVPITVMRKIEISAIESEICEPTMPREKMSRPSLSVPRMWIGVPSIAPRKCRFSGMPKIL